MNRAARCQRRAGDAESVLDQTAHAEATARDRWQEVSAQVASAEAELRALGELVLPWLLEARDAQVGGVKSAQARLRMATRSGGPLVSNFAGVPFSASARAGPPP